MMCVLLRSRLVASLMLFGLLACIGAGGSLASDNRADRPIITIGTILHNPPYVFQNPSRGIDLEAIRSIFALVGHDVEFVHAPLVRVGVLLDVGRVDGMTTVPTRPEQCVSSGVFSYWHDGVSVRPELVDKVRHLSDLTGLRLGSFPGAAYVLAGRLGEHADLLDDTVTIHSTPLVLKMLEYGRIDAYVGDAWGLNYAYSSGQADGAQKPFATPIMFAPTPRRLCFVKETHRQIFNEGLEAALKGNLLTEIRRKYVPTAGPALDDSRP